MSELQSEVCTVSVVVPKIQTTHAATPPSRLDVSFRVDPHGWPLGPPRIEIPWHQRSLGT